MTCPPAPRWTGDLTVGRIEYLNDPNAPKANTLVPACGVLAVDDQGRILLQRRRDTGQWALPMGKMEIGETPTQCAVRENAGGDRDTRRANRFPRPVLRPRPHRGLHRRRDPPSVRGHADRTTDIRIADRKRRGKRCPLGHSPRPRNAGHSPHAVATTTRLPQRDLPTRGLSRIAARSDDQVSARAVWRRAAGEC